MKFEGNSIRSLAKMLPFVNKHPKIQFTFNVKDRDPALWTNLGFNEDLEPDQMLIPTGVGKVTTFNAHGKEIIRKDLEKVKKSFPTFRSWLDWHGNQHSGIQHRDMMVYPRERLAAPSEALYVGNSVTAEGLHISTRVIDIASDGEVAALHLANLMLECFGEFETVDAESGIKVGTKLKRLQWEILPAGQHPWAQTEPLVANITKDFDDSSSELIRYRMTTIAGHQPNFLAMGKGGFNAYFVYGFESKGIFVLESAYLDNATYIFENDWESLSQLTKNEIINGKLPYKRIIHDRRWRHNIVNALRSA